jgi:predicted negative regulator of RcsB-dependent stress response
MADRLARLGCNRKEARRLHALARAELDPGKALGELREVIADASPGREKGEVRLRLAELLMDQNKLDEVAKHLDRLTQI